MKRKNFTYEGVRAGWLLFLILSKYVENLKAGKSVGSCVTSTARDAGKMFAEAETTFLEEVLCF